MIPILPTLRHLPTPLERIQGIKRCDHPTPFHLGEHVQWCPFCGALRYRLDRPSGELARLEWFRPSGVCVLADELEGGKLLSFRADQALYHLSLSGPEPGEFVVSRFGTGALLELVFRDLVDFDGDGLVSAKPGRAPNLRKSLPMSAKDGSP